MKLTEHEAHYEAVAQQIGIGKLRTILENGVAYGHWGSSRYKSYKAFPDPKKMAELAAQDPHLNNVPLYNWDAQHDRVRGLLKGTGIKSWSLCDTVCTLKHVAKFHYMELVLEELPPLTDTDRALAIVDRALAGESDVERERRTR